MEFDGGRYTVDWQELDKLCEIQCTEKEIAHILGCSINCLNEIIKREKRVTFREYFSEKRQGGKASLRRRQYKAAVDDGNVTMLIWLGKNWLGQKDAPIEMGGNMEIRVKFVDSTNDRDSSENGVSDNSTETV